MKLETCWRKRAHWIAAFVAVAFPQVGCAGTEPPPPNSAKSPGATHQSQSAADASKRSQGPSDEAVTNASIEARLRETFAELPQGSSVQRIALADVAYPANPDENQKLAGFTLMVVTAVTHDAAELPPRTFFRHSKGDFELPLLLSRIGTLDPPDLRETFGAHRFDGLYVVPLQATQTDGMVLANFKNGRRDFQLLKFPTRVLPAGMEALNPGTPDMGALRSFAEREFPIVEERDLLPQ